VSDDLVDLRRLKITKRTRAWLQARAHTSGRSMQEIARDHLDAAAAADIHAATVLITLAPAEGISGATRGRGR
jgi:hypothetical protein